MVEEIFFGQAVEHGGDRGQSMVKIFVEGGAQDSNLARMLCRQAFSRFFEADPILKNKRPRTVPCEGRKAAYDAFVTEMRNPTPGYRPLLLVDSEGPVLGQKGVWEHLKFRPGDRWDKPENVADNQAFLMVQVMETWFIADREAMKRFFGTNFKDKAIPTWPDLEDVPKERIYTSIEGATVDCGPKRYAKGKISFDLLATISPARVEETCPHAKKLFAALRNFD
jgi:hypothetical protein